MVQGIINIGSNSIRLAIYKIDNGQVTALLNKKHPSGLASYIKKEKMLQAGIDKTCQAISSFKALLETFHITNISAFATTALRNISNSAMVIAQIMQKTGVSVTVLSGTEETALDLFGATHAMQTQNGLLLDIGGASTELVLYENGRIVNSISLSIGSLNAYEQYVQYLLPNKKEQKMIKNTVLAELAQITDFAPRPQTFICGVGGVIRATGRINRSLFNLSMDTAEIKVSNMKKMIKLLENDEENELLSSETLKVLLKTVPGRIETIVPGLIILHTLSRYFKSETIVVSKSGIREGYLYKNILTAKKETTKTISPIEAKNELNYAVS